MKLDISTFVLPFYFNALGLDLEVPIYRAFIRLVGAFDRNKF